MSGRLDAALQRIKKARALGDGLYLSAGEVLSLTDELLENSSALRSRANTVYRSQCVGTPCSAATGSCANPEHDAR